MPEPIRISLGEAAFRDLAAGRLEITHPVAVILTPTISPLRMVSAILAALDSGMQNPPDPPEAREFLPVRRR